MSIETMKMVTERESENKKPDEFRNGDNKVEKIIKNHQYQEKPLQYDVATPIVFGVTCKLLEEFQPESIPAWHSLFDELQRDIMRENIFKLILQRRTNPPPEWVQNLEEVVRRLEERLYYSASSLEEYQNTRTLVARIEKFVKDVALEIPFDEAGSCNDDETIDSEAHQIDSAEENEFNAIPVSTQGCSRVFIVKVLTSVSEFVSGKTLPSISTFPRELVLGWLQKAKESCCTSSLPTEEEYYGGSPFHAEDPSTYWTEPNQLYTWWKNNVERKAKYKELQDDAAYAGPDARRAARARWCAVLVSLVEVIRCSSGASFHAKNLIEAAINSNFETMKSEIPASPELASGNKLHTLPSLQYPVGTIPSNHSISRIQRDLRILPSASSHSSFRNFLHSESRGLLHKAPNSDSQPSRHSNVPKLLLTDGVGRTQPNGYPQRNLSESQPYSAKEEVERANEAQAKKALYKERSEQLKASVQLNQKGYQQAFPLKLYDLVTEQNNDIIGWVSEGNAFKVKHMENFVNIILPAYFKHGNFTSFQRQLNLYGFRRTRESDKGAYYHANFLAGKRELAGTIRRCLSNNPNRDKHDHHATVKVADSLTPTPVSILPLPTPLPVPPLEPVPTMVEIPTPTPVRRKSGTAKSPKQPAQSCPSEPLPSPPPPLPTARPKKIQAVLAKSKENEQYSLNLEPKHEYGTRRKRLKKQFDEFVTTDEIFKRTKKELLADDDHITKSNVIKQSSQTLPMVYVSGLGSLPDCDEVIDMTSLPNQRRRLATRRIYIDMTPILTGREPIISESQIDINKRRAPTPKLVGENGVAYNTTLSSVSHSKLTRVGDEFQAVLPDLCCRLPPTRAVDHECLPVLTDKVNERLQVVARKKEEIFLAFSTGHVIVAVIPSSNSRRIRRSMAPPLCILPVKSIRAKLLSDQYTNPLECYMSIDIRKTLFPRLCVTLRRLVLIQGQFSVGEEPMLYFRPEDSDELIESPIWGCEYLREGDTSDSESEWSDVHCRGRDMYTLMSQRYPTDQSIYLEVTDGTQNWIVPLAVCASAGSTEWQEFFLQNDHADILSILEDDLENPHSTFTPKELEKLGWIDISMNVFFHQISPLLRRGNENLGRVWKNLQIRFDGNPWPSTMKEFISFCQRYCPHPVDSTATCDSRVVALRRLINMTSDIDAPCFPIEDLLPNEDDRKLLPRYQLPAIALQLGGESGDEDEEDEEISETDIIMNSIPLSTSLTSDMHRKHALLTSSEELGSNTLDDGKEEDDDEEEEEEEILVISPEAAEAPSNYENSSAENYVRSVTTRRKSSRM